MVLLYRMNKLFDIALPSHEVRKGGIPCRPFHFPGGDPAHCTHRRLGRCRVLRHDLRPILQGLAIAMMFGAVAATGLTLVVIPLLYYEFFRNRKSMPTD